MSKRTEVYLVAGRRTPIGCFNGSLASVSAPKLGGLALKAAVAQAGIAPELIGEVYFGNVLSANLGQAPASQVAYYAGLHEKTPCTLLNKVCASGMKAIMLAASAIAAGEHEIVAAGGMENMSQTPHYVQNYRTGHKYGNVELVDGILRDGLLDVYSGITMGICGEMCAEKYNVTRKEQDDFAVRSYQLSIATQESGKFQETIVPVSIPGKKGDVLVSKDEEPGNVRYDKIPELKPAFKKDGGTITAANASKINDGGAAVLLASEDAVKKYNLKPLARIVSYADAALAPEWFTIANVDAVNNALKRANLTTDQVDLYEINEAFAVVVISNYRLLGIPEEKVNVYGGAIALGHPIGASGTRVVMDLAYGLHDRSGKYGVATICNGGGGSSAIVIERV